jgi:hypothetical protein
VWPLENNFISLIWNILTYNVKLLNTNLKPTERLKTMGTHTPVSWDMSSNE